MDGKSAPQAPQPHLYPTISLYLLEPLLNRLWNVQVAYFRLSSSYVRLSTKNPSNSPWLIGLSIPPLEVGGILKINGGIFYISGRILHISAGIFYIYDVKYSATFKWRETLHRM